MSRRLARFCPHSAIAILRPAEALGDLDSASLSDSALYLGWLRARRRRARTLLGDGLRFLKDSAVGASSASRRSAWHSLNTSLSRRRGLLALAELPVNFGQREIGIGNRGLRRRNGLAGLDAPYRSVSVVQGGGTIARESQGARDPEFLR